MILTKTNETTPIFIDPNLNRKQAIHKVLAWLINCQIHRKVIKMGTNIFRIDNGYKFEASAVHGYKVEFSAGNVVISDLRSHAVETMLVFYMKARMIQDQLNPLDIIIYKQNGKTTQSQKVNGVILTNNANDNSAILIPLGPAQN